MFKFMLIFCFFAWFLGHFFPLLSLLPLAHSWSSFLASLFHLLLNCQWFLGLCLLFLYVLYNSRQLFEVHAFNYHLYINNFQEYNCNIHHCQRPTPMFPSAYSSLHMDILKIPLIHSI
jgi:hypothetical protein